MFFPHRTYNDYLLPLSHVVVSLAFGPLDLSLSLSMEQITIPVTYQRHPLEILQCPPEGHFQLQVSKQLCDDKEVT